MNRRLLTTKDMIFVQKLVLIGKNSFDFKIYFQKGKFLIIILFLLVLIFIKNDKCKKFGLIH